jgi:Na+-driven multidrug efflux pump
VSAGEQLRFRLVEGGGWRGELAAVARLALPVVGVQLGMMLMGVVDTMMLGRAWATP